MDARKLILIPASLLLAYFILRKFRKKPTAEADATLHNISDTNSNYKSKEEPIVTTNTVVPPVEIEEPTAEEILKYVELAEECEPQLTKAMQKIYQAKLENDYTNIKRAIEKCIAIGSPEYINYALRITGAIHRFWFVTGRQQEGYGIARVLFDSQVNSWECNPTNAKFFQAIGFLAHARGMFEEAAEHLTVALSYYTTLGNEPANAAVANQLGVCARERGEYDKAEELHETAMEIFHKLQNQSGIAATKGNLGVVAREKGDLENSKKLFEESFTIRKTIGDKIGSASARGNIATLEFMQGNFDKAAELYEKVLITRQKANDTWGVIGVTCNLGLVAVERNELPKARQLLTEAITSFAKIQDRLGMCEALEGFGCLEAKSQKWQRATALFGASKELRSVIKAPAPPSRKVHHDRHRKEISEHLSSSEIGRLSAEGAKLDFTQATAYALSSA